MSFLFLFFFLDPLIEIIHMASVPATIQPIQPIQIKNEYIHCTLKQRDDGRLDISGAVLNPSAYSQMELVAPNAFMKMMNYSGSGLPYPCASVAFEGTPNYLLIPVSGQFQVVFSYPNAYYGSDTYTKVPPSVFAILKSTNHTEDPIYVQMALPDPMILRTLTYRDGRREKGPSFYWEKRDILGVQGQEAILRNIRRVKEEYRVA
jgi:hypothetical protein